MGMVRDINVMFTLLNNHILEINKYEDTKLLVEYEKKLDLVFK